MKEADALLRAMKKPSLIRVFSDETALWNYIAPNLKGRWERLEAVTPQGMPDSFGIWRGKTWWCELKVGVPKLEALRPEQRQFAYNLIDDGCEHWTCFGYKGDARFYRNLNFDIELVPRFYRAP